MGRLIGRIVSALGAGAGLALLWGMVAHGLGHQSLRLAAEPQEGFAPLRWPDLPADRPVRLLLVGTSLTLRGSWAETLEAALSACRGGAGVRVERLARAGANSGWGDLALASRLDPPDVLPDLMIIEFSINDASLWHGLTLTQSRAHHESILAQARNAGIPVWLATMSPAFGVQALERPGQVAYRALYAKMARQAGAGLIAMAPVWKALPPAGRAEALPDNLHPTDAAMVRIAIPTLAAALRPVLCPIQG